MDLKRLFFSVLSFRIRWISNILASPNMRIHGFLIQGQNINQKLQIKMFCPQLKSELLKKERLSKMSFFDSFYLLRVKYQLPKVCLNIKFGISRLKCFLYTLHANRINRIEMLYLYQYNCF